MFYGGKACTAWGEFRFRKITGRHLWPAFIAASGSEVISMSGSQLVAKRKHLKNAVFS